MKLIQALMALCLGATTTLLIMKFLEIAPASDLVWWVVFVPAWFFFGLLIIVGVIRELFEKTP